MDALPGRDTGGGMSASELKKGLHEMLKSSGALGSVKVRQCCQCSVFLLLLTLMG